jgi:PAS domain S-box-containing protein
MAHLLTPMNERRAISATNGHGRHQRWRDYASATLIALAACALRFAMTPWVAGRPLLVLFVVPLGLSAYVGGLGPGLLCTVLIGFATSFFFIPPFYSFHFQQPIDLASWVVLMISGCILSLLMSDLHHQHRRHDTVAGKYSSTERKVLAGFSGALGLLALIGSASYLSVTNLSEDAAQVNRGQTIASALDQLLFAATEAQSAQRGYMISGDASYLDAYSDARRHAESTLQSLRGLTTDSPTQQQRIATLATLLEARFASDARRIGLRKLRGADALAAVAGETSGQEAQANLVTQITAAKRDESRSIATREQATQRGTLVTRSIIVGGSLLALALVALSLYLIRRDLSARRAAEVELDRFFSLSLDFLCIASADGYFKRVSPAVTEVLGWSVGEFLRTPYLELVHPDDLEATRTEVERQVVHGENVLRFENRYRHKDGSWRTLSWRSVPQPDGLMYATARDITELRRQEAALRTAKEELETRVQERTAQLAAANESLTFSERRFRALIEHCGDNIALFDANGKILYMNTGISLSDDRSSERLVGQSVFTQMHPEDVPRAREFLQALLAAPGEPMPLLWRRRHKLGHWAWLEGVGTNLLQDPAVGGIVANYRDVTDRQEAARRLQAQVMRLGLLSQITRAISQRQDSRGIFQIVVRSVQQQLPVELACLSVHHDTTAQLEITHVVTDHPDLPSVLTLDALVPIDSNGLQACARGELLYDPDLSEATGPFAGRLRDAGLQSLIAAPLITESKVFGVLFAARRERDGFSSGECDFLRQLSEHVALAAHQSQLYESLQAAYEELRQTQQAVIQQERLRVLGQMASGIAHDINNAISPVSLYTDLLLRESLSTKARGFLDTIRRAIDDVAETVGRMREFYRQRENEVLLAPVQLNTLIPQVVELTRARWSDMPQQRGHVITLAKELAADLPPILGVESEIREALTNLIFNAVDAMPQGGTLTLRTRLSSSDDRAPQVYLEVADTGVGMDEETKRRCLELFFTTKGERGTGLGLAMVYGIVQRHNGEIHIFSAPGNGTCMQLTFATARENTSAPREITATMAPPPGIRLLVVDDDPIILESMRAVLEHAKCSVGIAAGGQEGIQAFATALADGPPFELVITDLGMPSIDGRRVASAVKSLSPNTPVILLTGWGQRMLSDGDTPDDVDYVLAKPPKPRELLAAIGDLAQKTVAAPRSKDARRSGLPGSAA